MKKRAILSVIMAVIMISGALGHAFSPEMYTPMVPEFVSTTLAHTLSIILEAGIGVALLLPKYRRIGGIGFMLLMIAFLPIHVWDVFRETPAIGPSPAPAIRLVIQFVLIYMGYWMYKAYKQN